MFEIGNPREWSLYRKIAVLSGLLVFVSVFMPWLTMSVGDNTYTVDALEDNSVWNSLGWVLVMFSIIGTGLLFFKHKVLVNVNNHAYPILCGLIMFMAAILAYRDISDAVSEVNYSLDIAKQYSGDIPVLNMDFKVGYGVYISIIGSLLFLFSSIILWRESGEPLYKSNPEEDIGLENGTKMTGVGEKEQPMNLEDLKTEELAKTAVVVKKTPEKEKKDDTKLLSNEERLNLLRDRFLVGEIDEKTYFEIKKDIQGKGEDK